MGSALIYRDYNPGVRPRSNTITVRTNFPKKEACILDPLLRSSAHRVSVAYGERLPGARLPVGEHRGVVALEAPLHEGQRGAPVDLLLGGVRCEDVVEVAPPVVTRDDHLHGVCVMMYLSIKSTRDEKKAIIKQYRGCIIS